MRPWLRLVFQLLLRYDLPSHVPAGCDAIAFDHRSSSNVENHGVIIYICNITLHVVNDLLYIRYTILADSINADIIIL